MIRGKTRRLAPAAILGVVGLLLTVWGDAAMSAAPSLYEVKEGKDPSRAVLRIRAAQRAAQPIPAYITGKFCEHLGANIYNGMDAQVLRNPTFADYPFSAGQASPDGIVMFHWEPAKIAEQVRRQGPRFGWPDAELDRLLEARTEGLACWWTREGAKEAVQVSPDAGPHGGRAQRVEVKAAGLGIAQWTWLPLHRVRRYEVELHGRAPAAVNLTAALWAEGGKEPLASVRLPELGDAWRRASGTLEVPAAAPADAAYRFVIAADKPAAFILSRVLLRPADHVGGADPDVVRLLRESRLPILRWPGGNFVSGYHWEDGVGPAEARPTRPNRAWGGLETNLFGTDDFLAFCRAVGCEPMICINAGDGTPEEAARWVEYCNGPATSPMGARRAAAGHPEPYNVRHWEVGNELWGRWQCHWTTASGYVDRFHRFARAMKAADPAIRLYACGAPVMWGKAWNDTLIAGAAGELQTTTDHPLVGGQVPADTDPLDVFRDFMAVPAVLERNWAGLAADMRRAGIPQPRLAVTELQMFARVGGPTRPEAPERLTRENLVSPAMHAEALYDVLIYHACVRLAPFVEMVTHSATVNHGGGLRKERERVYPNPCHYAQTAFAAFARATPVGVEIETPMEKAPGVLADIRNARRDAGEVACGAIDALAAVAPNGELLVSIIHRGTAGPVRLAITLEGFSPAARADLWMLTAGVPWAANSLASPDAVRPAESAVDVRAGTLEVHLAPYTVARLRLRPAANANGDKSCDPELPSSRSLASRLSWARVSRGWPPAWAPRAVTVSPCR